MPKLLLLIIIGWAGLAQNGAAAAFDPQPWLDDFHQLLSEMSSHYANLDWAVEERRMDLPKLREETEGKLHSAKNDEDARRALDHFLSSFGDGHLEIRWQKPQPPNNSPSRRQNLCERLGYNMPLSPGLQFPLLPAFTAIDNEDSKLLPSGVLRLSRGMIGIIRIGLFSEKAYPDACEEAVLKLGLAQEAVCNDDCENRIELATANLLTAAVVRQAAALRKAGAVALIVDITRNGGGSNWMEAPPRALASVRLHDSRFAFIRHEHWTAELQERLRDVQSDLQKGSGSKATLEQAEVELKKAIAESKTPCDRSDVWQTGKIPCSLVVKGLLYTSGILDYAKPGSFAGLESKTTLFYPSQYEYAEASNRSPLYVLVDRHTWSAAEYFAVLLQNNHAATIVGELTGGAGCGYTNGGIPTTLKNSGAEVKMPDCVRFRPDGSNEVSGITPDVLVPWADRDSSYQRIVKVESALEQLLRK